MMWKVLQTALYELAFGKKEEVAVTLPKLVEDAYKYITSEPKPSKADRHKFTEKETEEVIAMWKAWGDNKRLYRNQNEFTNAVNLRFNTNKSTPTIIKYVKRRII